MGGGTNVGMDRPAKEDEQRLREVMCERGSIRICCHDPPHDEAPCRHLRPFHTASLGSRVNKGKKLWLDAGYQEEDKDWVQKALGWSVELVERL
jgi:hypothetical protein